MNLLNNIPQISPIGLYLVFIWSILWKGLALWRSAQNNQKQWFIAILILNTVGILEIVYLFGFSKKKMRIGELKFWEKKA